jgi:hypothetical protein
MRVGRSGVDTGEVGQLGYALAGLEFVGFLIGGVSTFFFIKGLSRCTECGSYLRKLKTKKTKELTFDEASKVIDLFKAGDLRTVQGVMAWSPPERTLSRNGQKALILFDLHGCSKCKTEVISTRVTAFNGKEWKDVPALTTRRDLSYGTSLRDQFA